MKNVKLLENRRQASKQIDENKRKNKKIMNNHQHRHWTMQNDEIQKHLVYKIQSKLNKNFDGNSKSIFRRKINEICFLNRSQDIKEKRIHLPEVDRTPLEPPPVVVALVGPAKVGKSLLMKSLIKNFTRQKLTDIRGPVTVVSGLFD